MRLPIDFQVHVAQLLGEGDSSRAEAERESVLRFPLDEEERAVASAFLAEAKAALRPHPPLPGRRRVDVCGRRPPLLRGGPGPLRPLTTRTP